MIENYSASKSVKYHYSRETVTVGGAVFDICSSHWHFSILSCWRWSEAAAKMHTSDVCESGFQVGDFQEAEVPKCQQKRTPLSEIPKNATGAVLIANVTLVNDF